MSEHTTPHAEQVRQLFDAKAPTWSAKYEPDGPLNGRLALLADTICSQAPSKGRLLDLGCGTGQLARVLAGTGMQVTACDISPGMLNRAVESDPERLVAWIQIDPGWRTLPFESAAFNAVVASSLLEYTDDPVCVLGECARVLSPGGFVVCTVPNTRHPIRWFENVSELAMRPTPIAAAISRQARLRGYKLYLQISRQRHSLEWWNGAARNAGLYISNSPSVARNQSPLHLLMLQRP